MRLGLALRAFFKILWNIEIARQMEQILSAQGSAPPALPAAQPAPTAKPASRAAPAAPVRSDALSLLAALQREARFVDLVLEALDGYSDSQIGAAARDVLRDCRQVLERMFALRPLVDQPESSAVDVPAGYDPNRFKLTGSVSGEPPFRGQLVHAGWQATQCQLPTWTGSADAALVVAPAEVEIR